MFQKLQYVWFLDGEQGVCGAWVALTEVLRAAWVRPSHRHSRASVGVGAPGSRLRAASLGQLVIHKVVTIPVSSCTFRWRQPCPLLAGPAMHLPASPLPSS